MWSFGLLCLEVFTDADPYPTYQDFYVPVLLSQGKPPENPGTAAVGLSSKMWELMQSCLEVDPVARPDLLKIQQAMRNVLSRVEPRPTVIARRPSTPPARIEPLVPTRVSPTIDGGSAQEANGSSSESSSPSIPAPFIPLPPSGGQLTLQSNPTISSPRLSRLPELEGTETFKEGTTSPSLTSLRLPPLREDDYELHTAGMSIPLSAPSMAPPQFSRSSLRTSTGTASILSSQPTLASDFLGRMSPTSSESDISIISELDNTESVQPKTKLSWRFPTRTQSPFKSKSTHRARSQTNPPERLRVVPSQSSTVLPPITTIRQRVPASEDVLRYLRYLQNVAIDPEALLRPARDGSVSAGNLEGLLNRAIVGSSDSFRDERFKAAFLTIYQLFATSEQVFEILKRRFQATSADPYTASSRYS